MNKNFKIAVIGKGYVGFTLGRLFATKFPIVGFNINLARVKELQNDHDATLEVEDKIIQALLVSTKLEVHCSKLAMANRIDAENTIEVSNNSSSFVEGRKWTGFYCTTKREDIANCNYYILTIPTPIDKNNRPYLTPL